MRSRATLLLLPLFWTSVAASGWAAAAGSGQTEPAAAGMIAESAPGPTASPETDMLDYEAAITDFDEVIKLNMICQPFSGHEIMRFYEPPQTLQATYSH